VPLSLVSNCGSEGGGIKGWSAGYAFESRICDVCRQRERRERCNECEWVVARDMNMTEGEGQQIEQNMDEREKINTRTPEKKTYELVPNNWSGHLCCKTSLDGYLYATKSASCSTNC
jgi:hypothetical protein